MRKRNKLFRNPYEGILRALAQEEMRRLLRSRVPVEAVKTSSQFDNGDIIDVEMVEKTSNCELIKVK